LIFVVVKTQLKTCRFYQDFPAVIIEIKVDTPLKMMQTFSIFFLQNGNILVTKTQVIKN